MNTHMKRAASIVLAAAMSMVISVTALAAPGTVIPTGSLTVTGEQLGGKKVVAVRMFSARATEGETQADIEFDSYELESEWLSFFKADGESGGIGKTALDAVDGVDFVSDSDKEYMNAAVAYVQSLSDSNGAGSLADFADKASDWYRENESSFTELRSEQTAPAPTENETHSAVTFANLNSGYYLVFPEMGSTGNNGRNTEAMLINVPTTQEGSVWNIKSAYPTVNKTVKTDEDGDFAENGSASIGDTITFKLESAVPDMSDFEKFTMKFMDTFNNGITYVPDSVSITIGAVGNDLLEEKYSVLEPVEDGNTLTITFDDLKSIDGIFAGDTITITYNAVINETAATNAPAENEVQLEYSNQPDGTVGGSSTPDISTVYVYDIDIHKYTGTWNGASTPVLGGATFVLSTSKEKPIQSTSPEGENVYTKSVISLVNKQENQYRVATSTDVVTTKEFTTSNADTTTIDGLETGIYYLFEISAPGGYNKLSNPITIVIEPTVTGQETEKKTDFATPIYTVEQENQAQDNTVAVKNNKGLTLPETGGIGTIGLTALGAAVILIGTTSRPRKK